MAPPSPRERERSCTDRSSDPEAVQGLTLGALMRAASSGSMMDRLVGSMRLLGRRHTTCVSEVPAFELKCERGHVMSARILREVLGPCCGPIGARCRSCESKIDIRRQACYRCHSCNIEYCMPCSQRLAEESGGSCGWCWDDASPSRPPIGPGDIILTGPCLTVHHVILAVGDMERASDDAREALSTPEDVDLSVCMTVESTPFYMDCLVGKHYRDGTGNQWDTYLHRGQSFFQRSRETGDMTLVGVKPWHSHGPPKRVDPLYTKFLLHPFRRRHGGPELDVAAFFEAVRTSELTLLRYGVRSCLKAVRSERACLDPAHYPDARVRVELLSEVRKRWEAKPICASVAITVWQRYFDIKFGAAAGPGPGAGGGEGRLTAGGVGGGDAEKVYAGILAWMPASA